MNWTKTLWTRWKCQKKFTTRCELRRANDVWFRLLSAGFGCSGITGAPNWSHDLEMQRYAKLNKIFCIDRFVCFCRFCPLSCFWQIGTYLMTVYGVVVGGGLGPECCGIPTWPELVQNQLEWPCFLFVWKTHFKTFLFAVFMCFPTFLNVLRCDLRDGLLYVIVDIEWYLLMFCFYHFYLSADFVSPYL